MSVADGDGSGVDGQCSVLLPSLHLGRDGHFEIVERPDGHHVHHEARQIRLEAVRHDQLHRAVLDTTRRHHGAVLSDCHDSLAQQVRTGTTLQAQQQVSTAGSVTGSVNRVQSERLKVKRLGHPSDSLPSDTEQVTV